LEVAMLDMKRAAEGPCCADIQAGEVQAARDCVVDSLTARSLAAIFKALGDPTRLRLISALAEREFCVGDLAAALEMEQSAVSHQLSDMRDMHLVRFRKEGRHVYYRLDDEHVRDLFTLGLAHVSHV
jgi:ArsR family transcriptional regulator, lead/cadmium/zinc/bismuth-responsive transcriptional repressor